MSQSVESPSEMSATCEAVQVCLELNEPLSEELTAHLTSCPDCRSASEVSRGLREALAGMPDWKPGDRILEQYEILERLGEGGQGAVFKARDLDNRGLTVALKVVPQDSSSAEEFINALGITHPNVCRVNHAKTREPFRVIVMEYVSGGTLAERLAKGRIPQAEAMALFRGICEGIRAAHASNVRHLDLKPSNVLIRDGVVPVVSDFGLAAVSGAGARGGTTGYMAPEQARGEVVDQRADVFALGVILAELVPQPSKQLRHVIERARDPLLATRISNVSELLRRVEAAERSGFPVAAVLGGALLFAGATLSMRAYLRSARDSDRAEMVAAPASRGEVTSETREAGGVPVTSVPWAPSTTDAPAPSGTTDSSDNLSRAPFRAPAHVSASAGSALADVSVTAGSSKPGGDGSVATDAGLWAGFEAMDAAVWSKIAAPQLSNLPPASPELAECCAALEHGCLENGDFWQRTDSCNLLGLCRSSSASATMFKSTLSQMLNNTKGMHLKSLPTACQ